MTKYIIKSYYYAGGFQGMDYIGNGTYMFQGEKYAVLTGNKSEAKRYSSRKRCENAIKKLKISCCNLGGCYFEIEEIVE